jgi:hypothetical protein
MVDLLNQIIELKCKCDRTITVTFQQVANEENIQCVCGTTINLKDTDGSVKRAIYETEKLGNLLRNMSK